MSEDEHYNYLMTIAYDGTEFGGWQIQPQTTTIQEILEKKLHIYTRKRCKVIGQGRTDAGVHALDQKAHFKTSEPFDVKKTQHTLNGMLPSSIQILNVQEVPKTFHARFSPKKKRYVYHIALGKTVMPFIERYRWHMRAQLSLERLEEALSHFRGTHDFSPFANRQHQGASKTCPVKTLSRVELVEELGGIRLEFEGTGFLYKMVRNIVGTVIFCARGKMEPSYIPYLFEQKDRRKVPMGAPAKGLFLEEVVYDPSTLYIEK